jgi:hypothetical protein
MNIYSYLIIVLSVAVGLIGFCFVMCIAARHWIWPGELPPPYVGSLISASGTILAATIAWAIADHNIQVQRERDRVEFDRRLRQERDASFDRVAELFDRADEVARLLGDFLDQFPNSAADDSDFDHSVAVRLQAVTIPTLGIEGAQQPVHLLNDISNVLKGLQEQKSRYSSLAANALIRTPAMRELEGQIGQSIQRLRTLATLIDDKKRK